MNAEQIPQIAIGFGKDPYLLFTELYEEGLAQMGLEENQIANKTFPPHTGKYRLVHLEFIRYGPEPE